MSGISSAALFAHAQLVSTQKSYVENGRPIKAKAVLAEYSDLPPKRRSKKPSTLDLADPVSPTGKGYTGDEKFPRATKDEFSFALKHSREPVANEALVEDVAGGSKKVVSMNPLPAHPTWAAMTPTPMKITHYTGTSGEDGTPVPASKAAAAAGGSGRKSLLGRAFSGIASVILGTPARQEREASEEEEVDELATPGPNRKASSSSGGGVVDKKKKKKDKSGLANEVLVDVNEEEEEGQGDELATPAPKKSKKRKSVGGEGEESAADDGTKKKKSKRSKVE